jgi:hypothetical protein
MNWVTTSTISSRRRSMRCREPEAAATPSERRTGQALIDAFAEIRRLLSDEEIDRMFSRNPSAARPVDLS